MQAVQSILSRSGCLKRLRKVPRRTCLEPLIFKKPSTATLLSGTTALLSQQAYENMAVISSVFFRAESANDVQSFNTRVKMEGSQSDPLIRALNVHVPAASESDCDSRDCKDSSTGDASITRVSGRSMGSFRVSDRGTHLVSVISLKSIRIRTNSVICF